MLIYHWKRADICEIENWTRLLLLVSHHTTQAQAAVSTRKQGIPLTLSAGFAFTPPVKAAIEVKVALAVCVKNGPLNVPLLHGMVTVAVAVAFTVIDDLPDEWPVASLGLVVDE
jgi:hypothetical protein